VPPARDCERPVWPDRPVAAGSLSSRDSRVCIHTQASYMHKHTCVQPAGDTFTCCQCPIGSGDAGPTTTESWRYSFVPLPTGSPIPADPVARTMDPPCDRIRFEPGNAV